MNANWSRNLAEQFSLTLPADVVAWFDSEIWKEESKAAFGEGLSPTNNPSDIWGGQMLPDTLPVLGNYGGDYLCLRFRPDGRVSEVVRWLHESSLWTPYGNSLNEALLFDAAISKKHADNAGSRDTSGLPAFASWALQSLDIDASRRASLENELSVRALFEAGLATTAARLEICKEGLSSQLLAYCRRKGGGRLAEQLGVDWLRLSRWLVDTDLIPNSFKENLTKATGIPIEVL